MIARTVLVLALLSSGCMVNSYSSDPNQRILQLMNQDKELQEIEREVERFWMGEQPAHSSKLTVANVLKQEATLFTVGSDGLTFVRTVPAGEAIDIDAAPGQRYAAVFASAPHHLAHEARPGPMTWLLRLPEVTPPRPAAPAPAAPARPE